MIDISAIKSGLETFTSAIGAVKALTGMSGSSTNAATKQQASDALAKLGEAREKYIVLQDDYIRVVEENRQLKAKLADQIEGEPCPKCRRKGWHIESSQPDNQFGVLGVSRRIYKCSLCGFSESKMSQ